jgi:hypothetical protein
MIKILSVLGCAIACVSASGQPLTAVSASTQLLAQQVQTDLGLPFQEFDQSATTGWRTLSEQACFAEAAVLIRRYREVNPSAHPVLTWHHAQMEAMAGQTDAAMTTARATLRNQRDDEKSVFRWNPYVLGTTAFLSRDLQGLETQRAMLARAAEASDMNLPNAKALARLKACFDRPYREATACDH